MTRRSLRWLGIGFALSISISACGLGVRGAYSYSTPRRVALGSDLWVVEGYDEPVFYSDGLYWRYNDGLWYSSAYVGGWNPVRYSVVPRRIRRIDYPYRYRHYRAPARARVRAIPPRHWQVRVPPRPVRAYPHRVRDVRVRAVPGPRRFQRPGRFGPRPGLTPVRGRRPDRARPVRVQPRFRGDRIRGDRRFQRRRPR